MKLTTVTRYYTVNLAWHSKRNNRNYHHNIVEWELAGKLSWDKVTLLWIKTRLIFKYEWCSRIVCFVPISIVCFEPTWFLTWPEQQSFPVLAVRAHIEGSSFSKVLRTKTKNYDSNSSGRKKTKLTKTASCRTSFTEARLSRSFVFWVNSWFHLASELCCSAASLSMLFT